jgi:uncharacterized membrane protein YeaQ/YmgE (transglycosylase-associated protein family)
MKGIIIIFLIIGSYAGSYLPVLWGGSLFSMTSIFLAAIGGFVGIWIGYKIANRMNLE